MSSEKCESPFLALWEVPSYGYKYWQISLRLICTTFINENNSWFLYTIKYIATNIYFVPIKCKALFGTVGYIQIKQDMALIPSQVLVWQKPDIHIQRLGKSQMVLGTSDDMQRQWLLRDARGGRGPNRQGSQGRRLARSRPSSGPWKKDKLLQIKERNTGLPERKNFKPWSSVPETCHLHIILLWYIIICLTISLNQHTFGISLAVQWLRLWFHCRGQVFYLWWEN